LKKVQKFHATVLLNLVPLEVIYDKFVFDKFSCRILFDGVDNTLQAKMLPDSFCLIGKLQK